MFDDQNEFLLNDLDQIDFTKKVSPIFLYLSTHLIPD